jgi:hypothetical protein
MVGILAGARAADDAAKDNQVAAPEAPTDPSWGPALLAMSSRPICGAKRVVLRASFACGI